MKVRVIKEMPTCKVGEEFNWNDDSLFLIFGTNGYGNMKWLIENGWLEEVKEEKTLKEKLSTIWDGSISCNLIDIEYAEKIATAHFKEKVVRWFDENIKIQESRYNKLKTSLQSLFDEEK